MKIAVAGHICLDIIPEWNRGGIESIIPGQLLEMDGITFSTGGAVANTGLALTKLGIDTTLVGKIGDDALGSIILDVLQEVKEDITGNMIISQGETSSYTIVLNPPDTDRIFLHFPGPNQTFKADDITYADLEGIDIFHFGYPPILKQFYESSELVRMMKRVREMGIITSLDMSLPDPESPAGKLDWQEYLKNVLPYVDLFLPSIDELLYMLDTGVQDFMNKDGSLNIALLAEIGNKLLEWGARVVAIKLGDQGLYLRTGNLTNSVGGKEDNPLLKLADPEKWSNRQILSPCFSTKVVGTTGAGDTTIAGFLGKFLEGVTPEEVVTVATAVGAFSVEAVDATGGIKPLSEVNHRLEKGWNRLPVKIKDEAWRYDGESGLWIRE